MMHRFKAICAFMFLILILGLLYNTVKAHPKQEDEQTLNSLQSQWTRFSHAKGIYDIFEISKEISFKPSDSLFIGSINVLDIGPHGEIMFVDYIGLIVYVFDCNGSLKGRINEGAIEQYHPGHKFRPFQAKFDRQGNLYITSHFDAAGVLHKFSQNLEPMQRLRYHTSNSAFDFTFDKMNNLFCYIAETPESIFLRKIDFSGNSRIDFGEFPENFQSAIYRTEIGGLAVDGQNNIFQVNPVEAKIYKYANDGRLLSIYENSHKSHVPIEKDLPYRLDFSTLASIKKLMNWTRTLQIDIYKESILILQYLTPSEKPALHVDIFDNFGNVLAKNIPLKDDERILRAKGDYLYIAHQPEPDKKGDLPNPVIRILCLKDQKNQ